MSDISLSCSPKFAVVFRTHFWDEFASRQLQRLRSKVKDGDIFVLVDETRGKVNGIDCENIFGVRDSDLIEAGYVKAGEGSIQWYSGDVPLYLFFAQHPCYDYYVQLEYDVVLNISVDDLVSSAASGGVDMIASTNGEERDWHWLASCAEMYPAAEVRHQLICLSLFSSKALDRLSRERLRQADLFKRREITEWPYCEGFIATEARKQGLVVRELSEFGDISCYEWWPPFLESEIETLSSREFVHPVLDKDRYLQSLLKYDLKLFALAAPQSWLHKKLRRGGLNAYIRVLLGGKFRASFVRSARQRLGILPSSEPGFNELDPPRYRAKAKL